MTAATRRRRKDFSRGTAIVGAIVIAIGCVGVLMFNSRDIDAARSSLPTSQNVGAALVDPFSLGIDVVGSLSSPAGRAAAARNMEARNTAALQMCSRDAETWRSFRARPPAGEVGARLATTCPYADPPNPSHCIAEAHQVLDSMSKTRDRWRTRFAILGVIGLLGLFAALVIRVSAAFVPLREEN